MVEKIKIHRKWKPFGICNQCSYRSACICWSWSIILAVNSPATGAICHMPYASSVSPDHSALLTATLFTARSSTLYFTIRTDSVTHWLDCADMREHLELGATYVRRPLFKRNVTNRISSLRTKIHNCLYTFVYLL